MSLPGDVDAAAARATRRTEDVMPSFELHDPTRIASGKDTINRKVHEASL